MIQVFIPNYKCVEFPGSSSRTYHVYTIQINNGYRIYTLEKRYSDFLQLHKELRKQYDTPEFPPKRVRNNRSIVLESRRLALQTYLQIMVQMNPIPNEIISFLNLSQYRQTGMNNCHYDDHANHSSDAFGGSNGVDEDQNDHEHDLMTMNSYQNPAAAFVEDPFLLESDSSSSNLSDCVTRGVLDALYQTDI